MVKMNIVNLGLLRKGVVIDLLPYPIAHSFLDANIGTVPGSRLFKRSYG